MTTHSNAIPLEQTSHETETTEITTSDALRRRAQSVMNDRSIDPQWRSILRYALETNDPWLADFVRRADAGEKIIDSCSQTPAARQDDSSAQKLEALTEMICGAGEESAAALLILMATLQNSTDPKALANTTKHLAFTHCGELNVHGMVDAQIAVVESELLSGGPN